MRLIEEIYFVVGDEGKGDSEKGFREGFFCPHEVTLIVLRVILTGEESFRAGGLSSFFRLAEYGAFPCCFVYLLERFGFDGEIGSG